MTVYSHWPNGAYPILINPTFEEILLINKEPWDTIRICEDEKILAFASGFGNTHQSIIDGVRACLKIRRWHPSTYILFRCYSNFYLNLEDVSGDSQVPVIDGLSEILHDQPIRDLLESYRELHFTC